MNEQQRELATGVITALFIIVIAIGVWGCFQLYAIQKQMTNTLLKCPCLLGTVTESDYSVNFTGIVETCNGTILGRWTAPRYQGDISGNGG